jgi:hypothetical protein
MTTHETTPVHARQIWTTGLLAAYLIAAAVATIGWTWFLARCTLLLFGY